MSDAMLVLSNKPVSVGTKNNNILNKNAIEHFVDMGNLACRMKGTGPHTILAALHA